MQDTATQEAELSQMQAIGFQLGFEQKVEKVEVFHSIQNWNDTCFP